MYMSVSICIYTHTQYAYACPLAYGGQKSTLGVFLDHPTLHFLRWVAPQTCRSLIGWAGCPVNFRNVLQHQCWGYRWKPSYRVGAEDSHASVAKASLTEASPSPQPLQLLQVQLQFEEAGKESSHLYRRVSHYKLTLISLLPQNKTDHHFLISYPSLSETYLQVSMFNVNFKVYKVKCA